MTEEERQSIINAVAEQVLTRLNQNAIDWSAQTITFGDRYDIQVSERQNIKIPAIDQRSGARVYGNLDLNTLLTGYGLSQAKKAVHDAEAVGDIAEGEIETAKNNALSEIDARTESEKAEIITLASASKTSISNISDSEQAEISSLADTKRGELDAIVATGIKDIQQTTTSTDDDGNNVITITLNNGVTKSFTVQNGSKGSTGEKGDKGDKGDTGNVSEVQYLRTLDTRNTNEAPSYYMSNFARTFQTEFKLATAIGLSDKIGAVYVFLITTTPWSDGSGGRPIQLALHESNGMYMRGSSSDSAWGTWYKVYSAGESKNMSANWTASQDSSGNLVFTYG